LKRFNPDETTAVFDNSHRRPKIRFVMYNFPLGFAFDGTASHFFELVSGGLEEVIVLGL
jgi:hypothetical protein